MRVSGGRRRGFALGEMLLAMLILGGVLAMVVRLMADQQSDLAAVQVASKADGFAAAAQSYYIANQAAIQAAMADGTGAADHCVVGADPSDGTGGTVANDVALRTCALDVAWLQWKKALPLAHDAKSGRASRWVAIYKAVYNGADPTGDAEMLVVMAREGAVFDAPLSGSQLAKAANSAGAGGGYVPSRDMAVCVAKRSSATYQACGAGSAWKVDLSDFVSTTELTAFGAALPE